MCELRRLKISVSYVICIYLLLHECATQEPDRYLNEIPQGQCRYTFTVPSSQIDAQCISPELRQYLEEIRKENAQISEENAQLKSEIQRLLKEYGGIVDTVKTLEKETLVWRETIEWPIYDMPFSPENISEVIAAGNTYDECYQAVKRNNAKGGIYNIKPRNAQHPQLVYCDSQGWTVVFKRIDGKVDFHRNWVNFSGGFGELGGEFFVGLELLHVLTSNKPYQFGIELLGWNNKLYTSYYDDFVVADEMIGYQLSVGNMTEGNMGSLFESLNGTKFTTYDRDNDDWYQNNCAAYYRGGWWLQNCGFDPSRPWCEGAGCMKWGEQIARKIILKIRPMTLKGSTINIKQSPKAKQPKKPKKKPRNRKTSKRKDSKN